MAIRTLTCAVGPRFPLESRNCTVSNVSPYGNSSWRRTESQNCTRVEPLTGCPELPVASSVHAQWSTGLLLQIEKAENRHAKSNSAFVMVGVGPTSGPKSGGPLGGLMPGIPPHWDTGKLLC